MRSIISTSHKAPTNTAVGFDALFSNNDGTDNTASVLSALYSNITGYYNTANGSQCAL